MKKTYFLLTLLLLAAVLFSACGNTDPQVTTEATTEVTTEVTTETTTAETVLNQTGYPSGEIQYQTVFVDGKLYKRTNGRKITGNEFNSTGYEFIGNTVAEDNINFPDSHLEASRTPVGSAVYRKGNSIYIVSPDVDSLSILSLVSDDLLP